MKAETELRFQIPLSSLYSTRLASEIFLSSLQEKFISKLQIATRILPNLEVAGC